MNNKLKALTIGGAVAATSGSALIGGCGPTLEIAGFRHPDPVAGGVLSIAGAAVHDYEVAKYANSQQRSQYNRSHDPQTERIMQQTRELCDFLETRNLEKEFYGVDVEKLDRNREAIRFHGTLRLYDDLGVFLNSGGVGYVTFPYEGVNVNLRIFPLGGNRVDIVEPGQETIRLIMFNDNEAREVTSFINNKH